ncbi:hypothetical protein CHRYSEO8AT_140075 [Chryseobacterium sp. 8AT]|nr:hypothetical protein CHRYSEO8AT_140075 [Chryseobacterium sp. 8AT]
MVGRKDYQLIKIKRTLKSFFISNELSKIIENIIIMKNLIIHLVLIFYFGGKTKRLNF